MIKVDETPQYRIFTEDLGSRVKLERKRDEAQVILEEDDADDMLDKLQSAANEHVKDYWIDGWQNFFSKQPKGSDELPPNMVVNRALRNKIKARRTR
jgi:hypothetical protein